MREIKAQIGFGGGCHWCTEAVFNAVTGVDKVSQGWISSSAPYHTFSEAVIVHYDETVIHMHQLIKIHLHTHSCTGKHQMRTKYRSAIYYFRENDKKNIEKLLQEFQTDFEAPIITKILPFHKFKPSSETYQNYYGKDPEKPFCKVYIAPKIDKIDQLLSDHDPSS
ncbi:peptide-methionine (S)-S-oxide reductase [Flavobacteriaceae bacterium M23B6Z8]